MLAWGGGEGEVYWCHTVEPPNLCLSLCPIDLEPEGRVYVIIDLSGSSSEASAENICLFSACPTRRMVHGPGPKRKATSKSCR
ncbi:hypothetical protein DPEC_G00360300 [Dallia pectoralis]|uniref:Uncharacterized protein n=1 Tax=Dallia pectoralis TaxID=75939 RepID=A0ACC2F0U0_DALPE|nr:hypothetical protein DPEC_G00360300 [Dallia pectoralis]